MEIFNELTDELFDVLCAESRLPLREELSDFSHGELAILVYLRDERSGLFSGELSEALSMTLPRMSAAISGLVKKGYVSKTTDLTDRRKIRINITPAGLEHVTEKETALRKRISDLILRLGEDGTAEYIRILKRINTCI